MKRGKEKLNATCVFQLNSFIRSYYMLMIGIQSYHVCEISVQCRYSTYFCRLHGYELFILELSMDACIMFIVLNIDYWERVYKLSVPFAFFVIVDVGFSFLWSYLAFLTSYHSLTYSVSIRRLFPLCFLTILILLQGSDVFAVDQ